MTVLCPACKQPLTVGAVREIALTPMQRRLYKAVRYAGSISRDELIDKVWPHRTPSNPRYLSMVVWNLNHRLVLWGECIRSMRIAGTSCYFLVQLEDHHAGEPDRETEVAHGDAHLR